MKNTVYPDIADTVLGSIRIPALPQEKREEYARPDTIKTYIPPELNEESDEEERRELERQKLIRKYRHKKIDRVTKKFKNATGQVKYNILWLDRTEETVPSKALQDHEDWDLVQHFEYQQSLRLMMRDGLK